MMKNARIIRKSTSAFRSLIFLHIPKTGGFTFDWVVKRQYRSDDIFHIKTDDEKSTSVQDFLRLSETRKNGIRLLMGHMPWGLDTHLRQPSLYITFLRDPVERIISHYYFVLRNPRHYMYDQVIRHKMTLDDYLTNAPSVEMVNGQTKVLAGDETLPPFEALERAKENLRERSVFGLTERFDESLLMMKKQLGWNYVYYSKRNVTRDRPSRSAIAPETIARIMQMNELDIQLYEYAARLFEERIQAESPFFYDEVEKFRLKNKVYGRFGQVVDLLESFYQGLVRRTAIN